MSEQGQESLANEVQEVVEKPQEAAPVEKSENATPPDAETAKPSEEKQPEVKTERTFTQAELDEIIQKRLAKESRKFERIARAEAEAAMYKQQLAQLQQPQQAQVKDAEPKAESFKTYEEYIDALTDWKLDRKLQNFEQKSREMEQRQTQQTHEERLRENIVKAADKYDDFQEVVESIPAPYVTMAMRDAIGESDIGGEIAYYLGNNHKEAADIAKLSPVQQVKAIDRLEAKLKAPPPVSKAPPPATPVGKGRAKGEIDLSTASIDEYMEARRKQGARWAR